MAVQHLQVEEEKVEFLYDDVTGDIEFRPLHTDNPTNYAEVQINAVLVHYGGGWDCVPEHLWERAEEHLRKAGILKEES